MKPVFHDPGDLDQYDAVEIGAMSSDGENLGELGDRELKKLPHGMISSWSVFLHRKAGGIDDFADGLTKEQAINLARAVEPLVCVDEHLKMNIRKQAP